MIERVVDAHVHFWRTSEHDWYPALAGFAEAVGNPGIAEDFGVEDYRKAAGGLPVEKFVHVSATTAPGTYLAETAWVDRLAEDHGLDLVIVGTVDPALPADEIVDHLEQQAALSRFRGVRVLSGLDPSSVPAGVVLRWLERNDHAFDLVTQPAGMEEWLHVLQDYPDLAVVLEHTGWPAGVTREDEADWRAAIAACAARTRAVCKVSGLGMTTSDLGVDALRVWVETAIEVFGWDRVAFGSNVPIEHMAGEYATLQETLDSLLTGASESQRRAFWAGNAERVYRF